MGETAFDASVLQDNLRCKIVFYSCFTPNTISDLNAAWQYSSPTYLYQQNTKETLEEADLITIERDQNRNVIRSNYDGLFTDAYREQGRAVTNHEIAREFLLHTKGFHPQQHHAGDEQDLLEIGRMNLDGDLESSLQAMEFSESDYDTLVSLWQNEVFRECFLSLEVMTRLFTDDKDDIPDNPLEFLFKLTTGVVAAVSRVQQDQKRLNIPFGLQYRSEKVIVPAYRRLKKQDHDSEEYREFVRAMRDTYSLFRSKFQDERYQYRFIEDFVDIAMQNESEKRFGSFMKKVRGDGGLLR